MKAHLAVITVIFLALLAVGVYTKAETPVTPQDFSQYQIWGLWDVFFPSPEQDPDGNVKNETMVDLDAASIIARVRFTGLRKPMNYCTLSKVTVVEVIKGDPALINREISLYEYNFFWSPQGRPSYSHDRVNLMLDGREYYVFMDKRIQDVQHIEGLPEYIPVRRMGILPVEITDTDRISMAALFGKNNLTFQEVADCPLLFGNLEAFSDYEAFYISLVERYMRQ